MSSDNHVHNCDNQVGAGGTQGGNFVNSTLHNPIFHIHSQTGRNHFDESSLLTTDPRRRPNDVEETLLRPDENRKKSDEIENQEELKDTQNQNKASLCIREQKRIRIIILILLPQILIIIITTIVIITRLTVGRVKP